MLDRPIYLACAVGILALALGCQNRICYDAGIDPSGRYKVSVIDLYDTRSTFTYDGSLVMSNGLDTPSCSQVDGIGPGATLELQAVGTVQNRNQNCELIAAKLVSAPSQIVPVDGAGPFLELARNEVAETSIMYAAEAAAIAGCSGGFGLSIRPGGGGLGGLFATPVTGRLPPALLYRVFQPSSDTCQACADNFVIQIAKE